jgi:CubicO group peptidase (beta-lactamase class C family)
MNGFKQVGLILFNSALVLVGGCNEVGPAPKANVEILVKQTQSAQGMPALAAAAITSEQVRLSVAGVLVEAGTIKWATTLSEVFPELLPEMRAEYRAVTLEQLLAHRGGILPLTQPDQLAMVPPLSTDELEARVQLTAWLLKQPSASTPGESTTYSNAGYAIAAAMLERKTGQTYARLLADQVLRPLNIIPLFDWPAAGGAAQPWGHESIAGNLSLNVGDYAAFIQTHLRGLRGMSGLLKANTYQHLHTSVGDFALGWLVRDMAGVRTSAHDGTAGTFYALAVLQPSRNRAAVVLVNAYSPSVANAANTLVINLLEVSP